MDVAHNHHHGSLMLSMQYNNQNRGYFQNKSKRNRRLSGTFDAHFITNKVTFLELLRAQKDTFFTAIQTVK